jgi:hypothetical protein
MTEPRKPPAYAWDWFSRQRLLWREARSRLATGPHEGAPRYRAAETRADVVAMLRSDYPRDEAVRRAVDRVVAEFVFLNRTDVPFADLGVRTAPRGMRWWWTSLTGEEVDRPAPVAERSRQLQLDLGEVHEGIGG